ncbi:hypothetical protein IQ06DRAFT_381844 [Phaeosphaeriaceae sp. SRC1lsM3a]|nr:hypothetical protein IQ06DRAFT_381844 [Stagonospora sp. SRC1lsM3a]
MALSGRGSLITPTTQSTSVNIATWFLASTFLIMYLSRQVVKFVMLRKVQLDDYLMTAGVVSSIGLSLSYSIAADHGLGDEAVSSAAFKAIQKACYIADLLFILATYCVKVSVVIFISNIAVDELQKRIISGLGIVCTASSVCMLLATAFQCGASQAWEVMTLHCFDQTAFWIAFGVVDILTEASLVLVSVMLVWQLHIAVSRKAVVVGCFAPRVLVIVAAICRLTYLVPINSHNSPAFHAWIAVVCTELQICLSISSACIPCIKPFFEGLEAGVWQADQLRRQGFSIHDLFQRGYARTDENWKASEGSLSVAQAHVEMKDAIHPDNHDDHEENGSSDVQALPMFVGGQWHGNM